MKIIGLPNNSNSCYINVILQLLLCCDELNSIILNYRQNNDDIILKLYQYINLYLRFKNDQKVLKKFIYGMQNKIKILTNFGNKQQDAHELLQKMLEIVDINDYFTGIMKNSLYCDNCYKITEKEEKYTEIILPISHNFEFSFNQFFQSQSVNIHCEHCKKIQPHQKKFTLLKLPKYLLIVFNRFKLNKNGNITKNKQSMGYPPVFQMQQTKFELLCVINHTGTMDNGHYYCFKKHKKQWWKCNDDSITNIINGISNNAYMLMYQKMN